MDDTNNRLQAMADELQITMAELIELADRAGLEIIAQRARKPAKHPGHC